MQGMETDRAHSHLSPVWFSVTDLEVVSGEGCYVTTKDGVRYLDFSAGIAVTSTGHCHPHVVEAISEQARRFVHAAVNVYRHDLLEPLARRLAEVAPAGVDTFFYANSGTEITEAAVKLAKQATGRPNVVVFSGSFHGRTHLAMAMTTSKSVYRSGYAPLPSGVLVSPFPDPLAADVDAETDAALAALRRLLKTQTSPLEVAAMIIEPVQGEGGYIPAPKRFLEGVATICKQNGILFVADEVQSGFGRTGRMFAIENYDVDVDIVCMAKGIASGFPFAALGARSELMRRWPVGSHGGTYGGNPIGCAAAMATIDVITSEGFLENVVHRGEQLRHGLQAAARRYGGILDVRGVGLMNACQFEDATRTAEVQRRLLDNHKVIVMTAGPNADTIRWMPPLTVTRAEITAALEAFDESMRATQ